MKTVKTIIAIPTVISDYYTDMATANRRDGNSLRSKEKIINKILKDYFLTNNK